MDDELARLTACVDEDEAIAKAAGGRQAGGFEWAEAYPDRNPGLTCDLTGTVVTYETPIREHATHIVRQDPARALREVALKRHLLGLAARSCPEDCLDHGNEYHAEAEALGETIRGWLSEVYPAPPAEEAS